MQSKVLRIGSWNIRGMGNPIKRAAIFSLLEIRGVDLVCLQETHLTKDTMKGLPSRRFQAQYHSVYSSYSRGVSILVTRSVMFSCRQTRIDSLGRYVFLYCSIENKMYVIANIYIPPPSPHWKYCIV